MLISANESYSQKSQDKFLTSCEIIKLKGLANRIIETVQEIADWEEDIYSHPEDYQDHIEVSRRDLRHRKEDLIDMYVRFGKVLNRHGEKLQAVAQSDKDLLRQLITDIYFQTVSSETLKLKSWACETVKRLAISLIQPKNNSRGPENLKPSSFFEKRFSRRFEYGKVIEVLSKEHQSIIDNIKCYLSNKNKELLSSIEKEIISFLEGSLERISLTKENGRHYLQYVKLIDLAMDEYHCETQSKEFFINSTYELRARILELGSPALTTAEAYTKTLDPKKIKDRVYLKNPAHWVPERTALHAKIVANQLVLAAALSKRLNHPVSSIWAVRGNTCSGKSQAIATDPLFHQAVDEKGEVSGSLNPDEMKYTLKKKHITDKSSFIINNQVHEEGIALFQSYREGLAKNTPNASFLFDTRLSTLEDLENTVFSMAGFFKEEISFMDIACSLTTSLNRVLTRDPYGKNPCPPLMDIVKGYKESIIYRKHLLEIVKNGFQARKCLHLVDHFKLYVNDKHGVRRLAAEKQNDEFKIISPELLEASCKLPPDEEIERELNQVITPEYIEQAIRRHDIPAEAGYQLEPWIGFTIGKAVENHVQGILPASALEQINIDALYAKKYGKLEGQPFSGTWLKDFPQIIDHLESEHLLHIRGSDEEGKGLHWSTSKFGWKLNPKFNPEAKWDHAAKGGFQMKLGYFIIPPANMKQVFSSSLSPDVLKEFEVRNDSGELQGYRFFVHPEAYDHFRALHDAKLTFVQPELSEFMGTPTSSYRSWVVRRVEKKDTDFIPQSGSVPFIVKLGVAGSKSSTDRLLPSELVEKSIEMQNRFDVMEKGCFNKGTAGSDLLLFPENLGLTLKDIPQYPPRASSDAEPKDSGIIVREFPKEFLQGKCKILSFSALMSVERLKQENRGICALNKSQKGMEPLPLIYEVIQAAMEKGLVKSSAEFIEKYLIQGYLKAIEPLAFQKGISLAAHGQNLCFVLNEDSTPRGFAYRDFEGISGDPHAGFIESYSWFYRYHVFYKLLNVLGHYKTETFGIPSGAPTQVGCDKKPNEKNLYYYLMLQLQEEGSDAKKPLELLEKMGLSYWDEYETMLKKLDEKYLLLLSTYFDLEKAGIPMNEGCLPAAESGSSDEHVVASLNEKLWQHRR